MSRLSVTLILLSCCGFSAAFAETKPKSSNEESLLRAASEGDLAALHALPAKMNWNAQDANGENALIKAISHDHPEMVTDLLAHKIKIDHADSTGHTALLYAVSANDAKTATLLIRRGASIDRLYDAKKENLLFEVARTGAKAVGDLIIAKNRGLLNEPNTEGRTPLFTAIENGQFDLAAHFIKKGANTEVKLNDGRSLAAFARENGVKTGTPLAALIPGMK